MDPQRLWAKSQKQDEDFRPSMLLPQHLRDVYEAARRVLEATATDQLLALGLDPAVYLDRFRRIVLLSAAVHDLGKANDHFQEMILGKRDPREMPQGLRHEWVTVLMLQQLRDWLLPAVNNSLQDFAYVEWAVAGHHPALHHASPPCQAVENSGNEIRGWFAHEDYQAALSDLHRLFSLGQPPTLSNSIWKFGGGNPVFDEICKRWFKRQNRIWDELPPEEKRLVAAAKDSLIAADVAGSALPKDANANWGRITASLGNKPEVGDLQAVVDHRLKEKSLRGFQEDVAGSQGTVTYVKAGCGCGKTLAAYAWAAQRFPTRRLYFCYPTTGTATEGFKDYLFDEAEQIPRIGAKLFHGRSQVDYEIILTSGRDTGEDELESWSRRDALESWSTPVVTCTVDTVLGLVQNNRRGLFAWPALAQAAFVFDEIHAFDDRLFGALLRFLHDLPGLPVLLMTASLPRAREEALREVLAKQGRDLRPIPGPAELEDRHRYHRENCSGNDPLPSVLQTLATGGKVLWVCNTVDRVMQAAARCEEAGAQPLIYHSRFRYVDRVERHRDVIRAFDPKQNSGAALAICSQVAEMSLDLSAALLVSDLAPVPSLIQRLGRLNRKAEVGDPTRPFLIVAGEAGRPLPYQEAELEAARSWLKKLPSQEISQRILATSWEQTDDQPPCPIESAWLDGGPTTSVCELREGATGVSVMREEDLPAVQKHPSDLVRYTLPMPSPPRDWHAWPRLRGVPIAPSGSILYGPKRGAKWAER